MAPRLFGLSNGEVELPSAEMEQTAGVRFMEVLDVLIGPTGDNT